MPYDHLPESARPPLSARMQRQQGRVEVRVIGSLKVRRGEVVLGHRDLGGPKPRQILEILLLNLGSPVSKDRLIEILWDGRGPAEALPTLESYVSVLRRHLQPGMGKNGPLRTVSRGYMLDKALVDLDLARFDSLLRRAETAGPQRGLEMLEQALALASAPLLEHELLALWAENERSRHAARVFHARTLASEAALSHGKAETAAEWARQALAYDPLSERAWLALILGLEQCGRPVEALRAFEQCRRTLDEEMGCSPGIALRSVHPRLLKATADSPAARPSLALSGPTDMPAVLGPRLRILTINRHRTFTELLTAALNREPDLMSIAATCSVAAGLTLVQQLAPDLVITDLHLPDGEGLATARRIRDVAPHTRIVVLAWDPTPEALRLAAALGVCVFLPKAGSLATMLDMLRHGKPEHSFGPPATVGNKPGTPAPRNDEPQNPLLTPRELEVLKLLAEANELQAAALGLNMSLKTFSHHVSAIVRKLGNQQAESPVTGSRRGLLPQTAK